MLNKNAYFEATNYITDKLDSETLLYILKSRKLEGIPYGRCTSPDLRKPAAAA